MEPEYCRAIESYLCQKNGGHLIRVVGPSFEMVQKWATDGVPLKIAFLGIDRYCERHAKKGQRRRPVRIDFCEADVLDAFDEWRRALGLTAPASVVASHTPEADAEPGAIRKGASLPAHLERVLRQLTNARVAGALASRADDRDGIGLVQALDDLIDRVSNELDAAKASPAGLRGEARRAVIERLAAIDAELVQLARAGLAGAQLRELELEADQDLAAFKAMMPADGYRQAREAAVGRLLRERLGLPTIAFG